MRTIGSRTFGSSGGFGDFSSGYSMIRKRLRDLHALVIERRDQPCYGFDLSNESSVRCSPWLVQERSSPYGTPFILSAIRS